MIIVSASGAGGQKKGRGPSITKKRGGGWREDGWAGEGMDGWANVWANRWRVHGITGGYVDSWLTRLT